MIKVITNRDEHAAALEEFRALAARDPQVGTSDRDALDLLVLVIDEYESRTFPFELPDPLDAINFRMEQQGLTARDLIPLLGSRSKVSEILSRRRTLSLDQIRALSEGLGIPAEVLIQRTDDPLAMEPGSLQWGRFPAHEMARRGWLGGLAQHDNASIAVKAWFDAVWGVKPVPHAARHRASTIRGSQGSDPYALLAWSTQVVNRARASGAPAYEPGTLSRDKMRSLVRLSRVPDGPRLACQYLHDMGIPVVIEPHLPRTYLDGAAIRPEQSAAPIVGMTLRHDRLDNFWFTLMHELAHIVLHLETFGGGIFYDDLDYNVALASQETEADELARDTLIPPQVWAASDARRTNSAQAAEALAEQLDISPAIVAGRMRYEARNYRILNQQVGQRQVRKLLATV